MAPKLTYFNGRGIAELVRLLCKYGDLEFEDVRIEQNQWPEMKSKTPFGQLPLWEEDGKIVCQSIAIARYIAKKVELTGANLWEDLEIDAMVDTITDLRMKCALALREEDTTRKSELIKTLEFETVPFYLERLNKMVQNGYMVLNKLTWADFYAFTLCESLTRITGRQMDPKYTELQKVRETVENLPQVKKWIEIRPETSF